MNISRFLWKIDLGNGSGSVKYTEVTSCGDQKFCSKLSEWEDHLIGSYLLLIAITSVCMNGMVIYVCARKRRYLVTSDYYIINLAISDLILPIGGYPFTISSAFGHSWKTGDIGCTAYGFMGFFFGLVSISTLTMMSVVRYINICRPQSDLSGKLKTKFIICCTYIYAMIWASVPILGWGSYTVEPYGTSCTLQWNQNRVYITLMSVCCILLPSVIMLVCYGQIVIRSRQSRKKISKWRHTVKSTKVSRQETYLVKITFAICWGFLITWMPYAVASMWTAYGDKDLLPIRLSVFAVLMAKASVSVNPVIYFVLNRKFRPLLSQSFPFKRKGACRRRASSTSTKNSATAKNSCSQMSQFGTKGPILVREIDAQTASDTGSACAKVPLMLRLLNSPGSPDVVVEVCSEDAHNRRVYGPVVAL